MSDQESLTAPCDLLVLAAFGPELTGLEGVLRPKPKGDGSGAGVGRALVCAAAVGIGLVEAARGTASRLHEGRPRAVVLIGTCGAYPQTGLSIGSVVVARSALLVEPVVVRGCAAFPEGMPVRLSTHRPITDALAARGARVVDVATTLAVTTDDTLATALGECGGVEHLEAFAVASACAKDQIPFAAVLAVANRVGSSGRSEWRANHEAAGSAAARYVARWIEAGAPGLSPAL
jgi:futalosine hydrolase